MERTSIINKLEVVKDLIITEPYLILVFTLFVILGVVLFSFSKNNRKKYIKSYIIGYLLIIVALIIGYNVSLYKIFDYLVNNVFYVILFPNVAIYGLMIIISNILLLSSILSNKTSSIKKIINLIFYSIIEYLSFIVLSIVVKENIDVYSQMAVYSNDNLFSIIQLSMIIFIIWIMLVLIGKIIRIIKDKSINKDKEELGEILGNESVIEDTLPLVDPVVENNNLYVSQPVYENTYQVPEGIKPIETNIPSSINTNQQIILTKNEYIGLSDILKREQIKK